VLPNNLPGSRKNFTIIHFSILLLSQVSTLVLLFYLRILPALVAASVSFAKQDYSLSRHPHGV
jgi:hypothetical protein